MRENQFSIGTSEEFHSGSYRVHLPGDGGALRALLTTMANSRRVAYLDDDNWWDPAHLQSLSEAMEQTEWAYSFRWWVQPGSRRPVCVDTWESVGPGCGIFAPHGGWVDPNCLMLDKIACFNAAVQWIGSPQLPPGTMVTDRVVFDQLRSQPGACTGQATVFYQLRETDVMHASRLQQMGHAWSSLPPVVAPG